MKPRPLFSGALAALLLWGVSSVPVSAQSTFKVGVVDMKRVFAEYYKTKEAEKSVNDGKEAAKKQLDERSNKYRDLIKKLQDGQKVIADPAISEEMRVSKNRELQDLAAEAKSLEREIEEFRRRRETQLAEQINRARKGILDEIKVLIERRAKEANYDLVLDKSGTGINAVPFLLYSKDAVDFSDDIIKELNKDAPPEDAASGSDTDKK